jgi:hypothetical protein
MAVMSKEGDTLISRRLVRSPTPRPRFRGLGFEELDEMCEVGLGSDAFVTLMELEDDNGKVDVEV